MSKRLILWGCRVLHSYSLPKRHQKNIKSMLTRNAPLTSDLVILTDKPNAPFSLNPVSSACKEQNHTKLLYLNTESSILSQVIREIKRQSVSCEGSSLSCAFKPEPVLLELLTQEFTITIPIFKQKSSQIHVCFLILGGQYE